ncbi:acetylajmalan esterase isoform X2 [Oryza sativa Japonica Group]|uniref:acetylajmalan esterase isoform X2 n=1 Tax=Oryza sativa subsp. japonica TaxID=39947 RepID=UPI000775436D|nr:uncharacterized protein LOC4348540 isoform X2 [Oryza sativa Japonica Group]
MTPFSPHLVAAAAALLGVLATAVAGGGTGAYTRVFSFGDSLTDTGNALHLPSTGGGGGPASRPPYGETFFRRPTGRASDGRLAVDFIVEALRLRHPAPYLAAGGETAAEFRHGVNFAVGGSTALPPEFYEGRGLKPFVPVSLANQTAWFYKVLQILGSSDHGRRKIMASSLFIVGEIGVNDYLVSLVGNLTVGEVETSVVPHIVAAIRSTVNVRGDRRRSDDGGGAGDDTSRLRAAAARALPGRRRRRRRRLRPGVRLHDAAERPRRAPQPRAAPRRRRAPRRAPRRVRRRGLRRPLPRRRRHRRLAGEARVRGRAARRVLRRRRRRVQLRHGGILRRGGVDGVRGPVGVRVVGRRALHRGGQQAHRLRRAGGRRRRTAGRGNAAGDVVGGGGGWT